jgi:hypothetical protein
MWGHWVDWLSRELRWVRCLWSWISTSPINVSEVVLSLVLVNGYLHYPNDLDRPLNEVSTDKIWTYRTDYHNRPSNVISYVWSFTQWICLLFLQSHWETDRFFAVSGIHLDLPVDSPSSSTWCSPHNSSLRSTTFSSRPKYYGLSWISTVYL